MFKNRRGSIVSSALFIGIVAVTVLLISLNRVAISDWWWFRTYSPPANVTALADAGGLSEEGRHWLYRTGPQFMSEDAIKNYCGPGDLGCITETGAVYILAYDKNHQPSVNRATVTAAHEMLHMAWRRTTKSERERVEDLLIDAQTSLQSSDLNQRVASYGDSEEQIDELHSMLGTEYEAIGGDLEAYYQKYFSDRSKVVEASQHQATP